MVRPHPRLYVDAAADTDTALTAPNAEIRRAGVDLNGLMTVLGKHLYSTPMVALRELVQTAHDSIIRRRIEQPGVDVPSRIAAPA
ncbi:hypothetical protein G6F32_016421 [Rhizopus arrhizus]|nr:hypothetical protein G6F32_016421 [Rhizopus arrhizus]